MFGFFVALAFVGMVLAPTAVTLYSRRSISSEDRDEMAPSEAPAETAMAQTLNTTTNDQYTRRPVPLSTSPNVQALLPVPSPRKVVEEAARLARQAQAEAAKAHVEALHEVSRAATRRAAAAAKLAEAAERELILASQASLQAEQAKQRAKAGQTGAKDRDYLPHDHPSLDFPRSRVPIRRVA